VLKTLENSYRSRKIGVPSLSLITSVSLFPSRTRLELLLFAKSTVDVVSHRIPPESDGMEGVHCLRLLQKKKNWNHRAASRLPLIADAGIEMFGMFGLCDVLFCHVRCSFSRSA